MIEFVLGAIVGIIMGEWSLNSYKRVLVMKAKDKMPEYIHGNFYHITLEKRFVNLDLEKLRREAYEKVDND
jgi:NAD(P)H-dependent FMN reductase